MQIAPRVIGTVGCSYKRYLSLYVLLMRIVSIDGAGLRPFLVYQGEVQFPFHARFPVASHGFGLRPKICWRTPIHPALRKKLNFWYPRYTEDCEDYISLID